ncbi:MAG: hypothetical protein OR994_06740 [Candidatus Poseidoniales archaeon]|nr:hypothetical protein [Candidatus Poseidoniales archaeon]
MARKSISVDHENKKVNFPEFTTGDPLVHELFSKLAKDKYNESFDAMLHIGALALMEDRVAHLIDSAEKEIYPQLERFKLMFTREQAEFTQTAQKKGEKAEVDIVDLLDEFVSSNGWNDEVLQSGKIKGNLDGNKVGDVLATIEFTPSDGGPTEHTVIGIEVKYDKKVSLGDPVDLNVETGDAKDKGFKASTQKTAWSQLLETKANRDSPFSIMVFDINLLSTNMQKNVEDVAYIPGIPGFVVVVNSRAGDYSNLKLVYKIARDMAIHHARGELDVETSVIELIVKRMLHYLGDASKISEKIRAHTTATVKMNTEIQNLLVHAVQHAEYSEEFLKRYLSSKKLTSVEFAEFYFAHPVAQKLRESSKSEKEFAKELSDA